MDNVVINKSSVIARCIKRINEEFESIERFKTNLTQQDSVILNLQRACEAALDIGNFVVRDKQLGPAQNSREVFALLQTASVIDTDTCKKMQAMVGLRNIAVHDYQTLNLDIVIQVIQCHLEDFQHYVDQVIKYYQ
jgi:uncharacterized protein YutE (UPF0331/DUF86 family)